MAFRVFFIDDEADICEIFADEYASDLLQIQTFTDPKKAIEAALLARPDVVFIDYRVPGTTGDKIAQAMAADIPKFLMTGEMDPKTVYKFEGIFRKPPNYEEIRALLQTMQKAKNSA